MAIAYERSQVLAQEEHRGGLSSEDRLIRRVIDTRDREYGRAPKKIQAHEAKRGFPLTGFGEKREVPLSYC